MRRTNSLLAALLLAPLAALHAADVPVKKPNILFIAADKANAALLQQLTQQWRDGWRKASPPGKLNEKAPYEK